MRNEKTRYSPHSGGDPPGERLPLLAVRYSPHSGGDPIGEIGNQPVPEYSPHSGGDPGRAPDR